MDQLHRHTYNAMRGTPGNEAMPHWDDLPEWVRSAMLAVQMAEREACAKVADESAKKDRARGKLLVGTHPTTMDVDDANEDCVITAESIAAAIRARKVRFHEKLKGIHWKCAALAQGTAGGNDPAECDWPTCGCDDHASRVISSLHESGWRSPDEVQEYAKRTREQVIREYEADKKE